MPDAKDLSARAGELRDKAAAEKDPDVRTKLSSMAEHYSSLAESEEWLAANPVSLAGAAKLMNT